MYILVFRTDDNFVNELRTYLDTSNNVNFVCGKCIIIRIN